MKSHATRSKWLCTTTSGVYQSWDFTSQFGRLKLIASNSRFLIPPEWHHPVSTNAMNTVSFAAQAICNDAVRPKLASQMCMLFVDKPLLRTHSSR